MQELTEDDYINHCIEEGKIRTKTKTKCKK